MKKLFSFLLVVLVFMSTSAHATQSLKAQVNGMVCAFCAQGIEKKLRAIYGLSVTILVIGGFFAFIAPALFQ